MSSFKLGMEVVSAHDLMPQDDEEDALGVFVLLYFDDQYSRTTMKQSNLNPVWKEIFVFNISDPYHLSKLTLRAKLYHRTKDNSLCLLGSVSVSLAGPSLIVPYSDAVVLRYPLQTSSSHYYEYSSLLVKEELGLRVFVTDGEVPNAKLATPGPVTHWMPEILQRGNIPKKDVHPLRPHSDHFLKVTSPDLGGGQVVRGQFVAQHGDHRPAVSNYALVETMRYLFVRVVKARLDLPNGEDVTGCLEPYVEVIIGNLKGITKQLKKEHNPEWNEVFAFKKDTVISSVLDVAVKGKHLEEDEDEDDDGHNYYEFVGSVRFDLHHEVPTRVPHDSPMAPKWYQIADKDGEIKKKGKLMLAVWYGTQADEAFPHACCSDAPGSSAAVHMTCSKVYHSPRLWYVRVNVIEARDLIASDKSRIPDSYAKVVMGSQCFETKTVQSSFLNPMWNEELMFVAAEPFDDEYLIVSVKDRVGPDKDETLGSVAIALNSVKRCADDKTIPGLWFNLEKSMSEAMEGDPEQQMKKKDKDKFSGRIHLRVCLDGGCHVLDESPNYNTSDLQPEDKQLSKPCTCIGVLELGVIKASGLMPMKTREGRGSTDSYCVAKFGHIWFRTRTIIDSLSPKYNEQHSWEVYDPATILTVGVFDDSQILNSNGSRDVKISMVQIPISTLESGRVYTLSYPLLVLHPSGIKKMGELHIAIRFSCTSLVSMMFKYFQPLVQDIVREQAVSVVAARLGQAEPPLRKEVVEYMYSDADFHQDWSMRRSKANFSRLVEVLSGLIGVAKWFAEVCSWKNPITTALVHVLFMMLVCNPELILPTVFLYMFVMGIWNFRYRPKNPPHKDILLSLAYSVYPDELDEEFDTFPSTTPSDLIQMRCDRLSSVTGRIQTFLANVVMEGERIQEFLSWQNPYATALFIIFCLLAAVVLYVTPFQVLILFAGFYIMRHPRFRGEMPSAPFNFFSRLLVWTDYDKW